MASFSTLPDSSLLRFVTLFWPKKVKASKLEEIHAKMVMKEGGGARTSPEVPSKKAVRTNKSNGASSSAVNGKSSR
jgi:chromodomain-helicase-DNA-binding protein 1